MHDQAERAKRSAPADAVVSAGQGSERRRLRRLDNASATQDDARMLEQSQAEQALERISAGESLRQAASAIGLSSEARIREWADADPANSAQYARALEQRADWHANRIEQLARAVEGGHIAPDVARVAIDARKWVAAKLRPKRYGDRIQADVDMTLRVTVDDPTLRAQVVAQHSLPNKPDAE